MCATPSTSLPQKNSTRKILLASLIGTTIEFFDFYIFATAAVLVFPHLFFPSSDPTTDTLKSLATFSLAFFARPIGAIMFGHFGDKVGRKATLVAALLTMGLSTVCIGLLPTHATIGIMAPLLLAVCRFSQGLGLGGEWGGAILLATENAPAAKKSWYGMFPQLGAPLGFICSTSLFLIINHFLTEAQFFAYGWRIPFLASSLLVLLGLYMRLSLTETPEFAQTLATHSQDQLPIKTVIAGYWLPVLLGAFAALSAFVIFYLMTVFALSYATNTLHYSRQYFLQMQLLGVVFFALAIPLSARLADRFSPRTVIMGATLVIAVFGLFFAPLFLATGTGSVLLFLSLGLAMMGFAYGPLGTLLAALFPTPIRYTGSSLAFNLAGILGASLVPYIATRLSNTYGLAYVGYYLTGCAALSLFALLLLKQHSSRH